MQKLSCYFLLLLLFGRDQGRSQAQTQSSLSLPQTVDRIDQLILEMERQPSLQSAINQELNKFLQSSPFPQASLYLQFIEEEMSDGDFQRLRQKAREFGDKELEIRTLVHFAKLKLMIEQDAEHSLHILNQAETICSTDWSLISCSRVFRYQADAFRQLGDIPNALSKIQKALHHLKGLQGLYASHYYNALALMASIFLEFGEGERSVQLSLESLEWYANNQYYEEASTVANNIALQMLRDAKPDILRIENLLQQAKNYAQLAKSEERLAHLEYATARLLALQGKWSESELSFARADQLFMPLDAPDYRALCLIGQARAQSYLRKLNQARRHLDQAKELIPANYHFELMQWEEVSALYYQSLEDAKNALIHFQNYHQLYKKMQDLNEEKSVKKLGLEIALERESERNRHLQKEMNYRELQLLQAQRLNYLSIIASILALMSSYFALLSWKRLKALRESNGKMRSILDHTDDGLFIIESDLAISRYRSLYLSKIHQELGENRLVNFVEFLKKTSRLSAEELSMHSECLRSILGEDSIAWDLNSDHLIRELKTNDDQPKEITVQWFPIHSQKNRIDAILVKLRDVTQERLENQKSLYRSLLLESMPKLMQELKSSSKQLCLPFLRQLDVFLQQGNRPEVRDLKAWHTKKGEARSLGLKTLSSAIHQLESELLLGNTQGLSAIRELLTLYLAHLDSQIDGREKEGLSGNLLAFAHQYINNRQEDLKRYDISLRSLFLEDLGGSLAEKDLVILQGLCLHGINNSLDHGFIRPKQKGIAIDNPRLLIQLTLQDGFYIFMLKDNGCGVNFEVLEQKAEALGLKGIPREELAFELGLSSAETLTETSGRGLGLAELKHQIQRHQGKLRLNNLSEQRGACLIAEWRATQAFIASA